VEPWLRKRARLTPDAPALVHDGAISSFATLDAASDLLARGLAARGITANDRVGLLASPSPQAIQVIHALQYLGATLVPFNARSPAREVRELATIVRPTAVLHDSTTISLVSDLSPISTIALGAIAAHPPPPCPETSPPSELSGDAIHSMLFTSGTTGRPKVACLTHANHEASARASAQHLAISARDRWLLCMPLCHVGGLAVLLRSAITGFAVVLQERFDPDAVNRAIVDDSVSLVSVVPTMLVRMLDALGARSYPETLRVVLTGGGPLAPALAARARTAGVPVVSTYGLTEAASQVATGRPGMQGEAAPMSATAIPGTDLRIREPDAAGIGEILVRGPTVMQGYFEDAVASRAALREGWLHTGDAGRLEAGALTVVGRRSDLIVTGGENVYPAEVERVLAQHPSVEDVAVYGIPDDEWGECVVAAIVVATGGFDPEAVRAWSGARLAGYKIPRVIRTVTTLPRTTSGKLRRAELRAVCESAV